MKPTYNENQQCMDFGEGFLLQDVCSVLDMDEFPDVSPEDVIALIRCKKNEYGYQVYRKAMEIWEDTVDREIVDYLRSMPNTDPMSVEKIAIVLGQETYEIEEEIQSALNSLGYALDQLEIAA